jgi:hypothetical protein
MNHSDSILRRLRLLLAAVAALALLVVPSAALAKKGHGRGHDRNHDGIPDKWEKKHGISTTKRSSGKADPDKDGLTNRSEWQARTNPKSDDTNRNGVGDADEDLDNDDVDNGNEQRERTKPRRADTDRDGKRDGKEDADRDRLNNAGEDDAGTDPMDADSDGDGVKDGDEHAGEITAWDGTTLTIRVFGGATLTGIVDEDTYIGCNAGDDDLGDVEEDPTWSGDPTEDELGKVRARTNTSDDDDDLGDDELDDLGDDYGSDDADDLGDDELDDLGDDYGDDEGDDDYGDDSGSAACRDALKVGVLVTEASLGVTSDGSFFDTVELDD